MRVCARRVLAPLNARTPVCLARCQTVSLVRRPDSIDEGKNERTHARIPPPPNTTVVYIHQRAAQQGAYISPCDQPRTWGDDCWGNRGLRVDHQLFRGLLIY